MDSPAKNEALQELEVQQQELHNARRRIELLTASVNDFEIENAELNSALSDLTQKYKDAQSGDLAGRGSQYKNEVYELRQMLEASQTAENLAKEAEQRLTDQLLQALRAAETAGAHNVDSDITAYQLKIDELETEKASLQMKVSAMVEELHLKYNEVVQLKQEVADKDEELECLDSNFNTQCELIQRLREESLEMKAQLHSEPVSLDEDKKGNSLFAEVDDRRVAAEKRILKLESMLANCKEKSNKEEKEIQRLKLQVLRLRHASVKGYDETFVKDLQAQLLDSKNTVIQLTQQLHTKDLEAKDAEEKLVLQFQKTAAHAGSSEKDQQFIEFLQAVVSHKSKQIEEAKEVAHQNHIKVLRAELRQAEESNKMRVLTHRYEQLKITNSDLVTSLQEMQRKYKPDQVAESQELFPCKDLSVQDIKNKKHSRGDLDKENAPGGVKVGESVSKVLTENSARTIPQINTHLNSTSDIERQVVVKHYDLRDIQPLECNQQ